MPAPLVGLVAAALTVGCFHDDPPTAVSGAGSTGGSGGDPASGTASSSATSSSSGAIATSTGPMSTSLMSDTSEPGTTGGATTTGPAPDMGAPASVCPDSPDLLACYTFERGWRGALLQDESGQGRDGVMQGVTKVPGRRGFGASTQDTSTIAVAAADAPSFEPTFTVMAWVGPHMAPTGTRAGVLDRDGHYGLFLGQDARIQCGGLNGLVSKATVSLDGWTHVACTWKDGVVAIFIDGVADTFGPVPGSQPQPTASLVLANDSPPSLEEALVGTLDEVLVWRRALTAAELCDVAGLGC